MKRSFEVQNAKIQESESRITELLDCLQNDEISL